MQRLKIDLLKFNGAKKFNAKDGSLWIAIPVAESNIYVGEKGAYGELTVLENKNGADQYGNDGFVALDLGKARREAGEKGPILGNWKHVGANQSPPQQRQQPQQKPKDSWEEFDAQGESDDLPF